MWMLWFFDTFSTFSGVINGFSRVIYTDFSGTSQEAFGFLWTFFRFSFMLLDSFRLFFEIINDCFIASRMCCSIQTIVCDCSRLFDILKLLRFSCLIGNRLDSIWERSEAWRNLKRLILIGISFSSQSRKGKRGRGKGEGLSFLETLIAS